MSFAAQGGKKEMYKIKINKHLTLSYRNCHEVNEEEEEEEEEKKEMYEIKTTKHLTLSYKNYLQNCHTPP